MTMPIGSPCSSSVLSSSPVLYEGSALPAVGAGAGAAPAVLVESAARQPSAAGDLAVLLLSLETEKSRVEAKGSRSQAQAHRLAQSASVQQRLGQLERAAKEQAKSDKWGEVATAFKWIGAAVAAIAGVAGAVFSGGSTIAIAAVIITAIFTAETCVKSITEALVDSKVIDDKTAALIQACLGSVEGIVATMSENGVFGNKGETVARAFAAAVGLVKAVVQAVVSGGGGSLNVASAVCSCTAEGVRLARESYELVITEMKKEGELDQDALLALDILGVCLDMVALGTAAGSAGSSSVARPRAARVAETVASSSEIAAAGGRATGEVVSGLAEAAASQASSAADRESARIDALRAMLAQSRKELDRVLSELEEVRDQAEDLLEVDAQQAARFSRPTRA